MSEEENTSLIEGDVVTAEGAGLVEGDDTTGVDMSWFKEDKYKTVEDQAKAYNELEKKFGSMTGAPEEYEFNLAEGVEFEVDNEDELLGNFKELAKELGMSQEGFDKFSNLYVEQMLADNQALEMNADEHRKAQHDALGPKANDRISNVAQWVKAQLGDEESFNQFAESFTDASQVEWMEKLMSNLGNAPQATAHQQQASPPMSKEQLDEMQFAKDEFGERKMRDPEYAAKYRKELEKFTGKGHTREII